MLSVFDQDFAVDDSAVNSVSERAHPPAIVRQIVNRLGLAWLHRLWIENHQISRQTRLEQSAIVDSKGRRRIESQTPDRMLQRHDAPFAHPVSQQACAIAHLAMELHVCSAIGKAHYGVRAAEKLRHGLAIGVVLP